MPWIKVDVDFPDHPKIKPIAEALGIEKDHAAGILTRWFCWVRKYAQDGCLEGKEFEAPGFSPEKNRILTEALTTSGFIKSGWVNDWPEYGGAEIAEKAKREPSKFRNMLDFYGLSPYGKKTGKKPEKYGLEEKRRDKKRIELKPMVSDWDLKTEEAYNLYPARRPNGSSTNKSHRDKIGLKKLFESGYDVIAGMHLHIKTANGYLMGLSRFINHPPDLALPTVLPEKKVGPKKHIHHFIAQDGQTICALCGLAEGLQAGAA